MTTLAADRLTLAYADHVVVPELSLELPAGKVTALVGPNGSGKSTILKALARLLKPRAGTVLLDGRRLSEHGTRGVARRLSILPQRPTAPDSLTVRQLVGYGRAPHQRHFAGPTREDHAAIDRTLHRCALTDLADRPIGQLSGGQRQRAWVGMALAQDTPILLLDEPTTFLDMAHQLELLQLLGRANHEQGKTIVMVLHDLNLAARFADHIIAIRDGRIAAQGPPSDVICPAVLEAVFGVSAHIVQCPQRGVPLCIPYPLAGP